MKIHQNFHFASVLIKNQGWVRQGAAVLTLLLLAVLLVNVQPQSALAASIGTYDQCSNDLGTGYTTGDTGCRWINGNLQSNNSRYFEGDATVQRLWLTDFLPGTTHTVTFKYGTTKGGKHAYDFLTTWDWSESWITVADRCQDITGCTTATDTALDIPEDPNVPNAFEPSAPGDRQFVMRGGTLDSATTPAIVSGSYAGDSETVITVTFTVGPNNGSMCATATSCSVAIWFGAHVSAQANWGTGNGAGSISGSPYHVSLEAIDGGSIGQRDNQMQASVVTAIPNGTIVIVKDVSPGTNAQNFDFRLTNNDTITQDFQLDDDADGTLPNSQTFSVPPGIWSASELNIPTGWTLTNISCVDPTGNTTVLIPTATINLASNETVTCTYTNTPPGTITIVKDVDPGTHPQNFDFRLTNNITTYDFQLDDDADVTLPNSRSFNVVPGTWTATELNIPSGWVLTGIVCVDPTGNTTVLVPTATINVAMNETVTCTFTNKVTATSVSLSAFKAVARAKNIRLKWRTGSELNILGFNVLRSTEKHGTYEALNDELIPAKNPGQLLGAKYVFRDRTAEAGVKYFYKLELIDGNGATLEVSNIVKVRKPPSQ